MKEDPNIYPPGWNRERVQEVIDYYDKQIEEEAEAGAPQRSKTKGTNSTGAKARQPV
jgi:hypothetical protein